jgi:guanylate kinase
MTEECTQPGKLLVVSGPSGVGKSTVDREVIARSQGQVVYSVSATTRQPREGEIDGQDYHFVSREAFDAMIDNDELLEHADVFGNDYGTPAGPVQQAIAAGKTVLLEIDVQGGLAVAKRCPEATFALIVPPSNEELETRLRRRGTEDEATVQKRLNKAQWELATARESGAYPTEIVNDDLEEAITRLLTVALP